MEVILMFELIKELTGAFGVSGNEEEIRELIKKKIGNLVDEIRTDALGNLIAIKRGKGKKIMLAAHMDEIGVMATFIDDKGFIRFSNIGWVSAYFALAQRVKFKNGIIGTIFYEEKLEDMKNLKLSNMYIDIGAKSKEEAAKSIKIGDVACFVGEAFEQNGNIIAKSLDDRCGCAILIKTVENLDKTDNEIYFVFTVQEELGLRGAKTAAFQLLPDIAIAIDVTSTGDTPECKLMEVRCGGGPTIKIKDGHIICHTVVKKLLEDAARKQNIPFQYEILESGGTDAGAIHVTAGGIPSGVISIPCRYIHSTAETVDINDLENAAKLLFEAIK
jgi:tetrahedral aminopeptidase